MENRRNFRFELRLNEEEYKLFQQKSQSYNGNISALIRDAVSRFDDQKARGKIEAMTDLVNFYKTYQQQLSWFGSNFNQAMHRANELAVAGELNPAYLQKVIMPKVQESLKVIRNIKSELDNVHENLER